jgi:serine protease AprX
MKQFLLFFLLFFCCFLPNASAQWQQKIDAQLLNSTKITNFLVILREQTDVSFAYHLPTKEQKGEYVFKKLQATAFRSQKNIQQILQKENAPFRTFFIVNALHVTGNKNLIEKLAQLPEVARINANPTVPMQPPVVEQSIVQPVELRSPTAIEWGIQKIKADSVWLLGIKGEGVVIGGQDTGFEWTHPTLQKAYRGWDGTKADHNYNWYDAIHAPADTSKKNPCGFDTKIPCDDNNHGTHTMGTMVGSDGGSNQIGVAPAARWVAARNMNNGNGTPATYIACFEWFLAPTDLEGKNPKPTKAPHVINNSWGCPTAEGCNVSNFPVMNQVINNMKAAGIVVVVSAGNSGKACSTINDAPSIFENSFAVGATGQNDTIASFSSRGIVTVDGSNRLKPNVSAPGVNVRSSIKGGRYAIYNGTSMAGPHVAGAVALIISANPKLAGRVVEIEKILEQTARPMTDKQDCNSSLGSKVPNAVYGFGRIDVLAAVKRARSFAVATQELDNQLFVKAMPNPMTDIVRFEMEHVQEAQLILWDAMGKVMLQKAFSDTQLTLNVQDFPKGIYLYQIKAQEKIAVGKLVKW